MKDDLFERLTKVIRESEAYWWNRSDEPEEGLAETLAAAVLEIVNQDMLAAREESFQDGYDAAQEEHEMAAN